MISKSSTEVELFSNRLKYFKELNEHLEINQL